MRIRSTKPEFWRSARIASVDWDARLVLKGLESYVDDNGVGRDDLALIVSDVFPRDLIREPSRTLARVSEAISTLSEAGLVHRYETEGTPVLYLAFWELVQRVDKPAKGRFRRPDGTKEYGESEIRDTLANPREMSRDVAPGTGEQGNRGTGEQGNSASERAGKPAPAAKSKLGSRLPDDWRPTPDLITWVKAECPDIDGRTNTDNFCDYWHSKAGRDATKLDWDLTYKKWMRDEQSKAQRFSRPPATNGHRRSTTDDAVNQTLEMARRYAEEDAAAAANQPTRLGIAR